MSNLSRVSSSTSASLYVTPQPLYASRGHLRATSNHRQQQQHQNQNQQKESAPVSRRRNPQPIYAFTALSHLPSFTGTSALSGTCHALLTRIEIPSQRRRRLPHRILPTTRRVNFPQAVLEETPPGTPFEDGGKPQGGSLSAAAAATPTPSPKSQRAAKASFIKVQRRIAVGFAMGAVAIAFVFSPRWIFATGLLALSLIGLSEYYRMVTAKGHLPARKMGLCVTTATMLASAYAPSLADVAFPLGGTMICIYLLLRRSKIATIADISTTFMGLFYAGYLPSYWVRLHAMTSTKADNLIASAIGRLWPSALVGFQPAITIGSLLVFWTWLSTASADIGAFFFGRMFGRTRFSNISPKKTVEGAVAGFLCSAGVSVLGAYLMNWPVWWATGAVYGVTVGVLGLCGDLFESCFKRDVGWKDSGSLFPGHGGVLDRADSYVLVAPLVYFFATLVLPVITQLVR